MRALGAAVLILAIGILAYCHASAHDPFTGLTNQYGGSCCGSDGPASDCKPTITRY